MKIVILRGLPGSGKSHFAESLRHEVNGHVMVCSADDFFIGPSGEYDFDPRKLSEAHAACFRKYVMGLLRAVDRATVLLVDNTNLNRWELSPYVQAAMAFKIPAVIYTVKCNPERAYERNIHKVPWTAFSIMMKNLVEETPKLLHWWVHHTDPKDVLDFLTGDRKVN